MTYESYKSKNPGYLHSDSKINLLEYLFVIRKRRKGMVVGEYMGLYFFMSKYGELVEDKRSLKLREIK